jgi:hypothetical protein
MDNKTQSPYVEVKWLALLLRIREICRSNLGPETGYPDSGLLPFLQEFKDNTQTRVVINQQAVEAYCVIG